MKKQYDATQLANELEGSSAYFQKPKVPSKTSSLTPTAPSSSYSNEEPASRQPSVATDQPADRSVARPTSRSLQKRQTQRRAFEFYRDQIETFKCWLAVEIAQGGNENMSVWAREAFDAYIANRSATDRAAEQPADQPIGRMKK